MRIQVTHVESKDIKTKSGQSMTLRVAQGMDSEGRVFKIILPRGHEDVARGVHTITAEPYINYDAELASRLTLTPVPNGAGSLGANPLGEPKAAGAK